MDHTVQRNKRMLEKVERKGQGCGVAKFQYTVYVTRWCLFVVDRQRCYSYRILVAHRTSHPLDLRLDLGLGT